MCQEILWFWAYSNVQNKVEHALPVAGWDLYSVWTSGLKIAGQMNEIHGPVREGIRLSSAKLFTFL